MPMSEIEKITLNGKPIEISDKTSRNSINNLSKVAKTGLYNDLTGKPIIPSINILKNVNFSKMSVNVNGIDKTLIWGKAKGNVAITNNYGNGYYGNYTIILPNNIGTIDNYDSCLVSAFASGAVVNANVDTYTRNSVKLVLSSVSNITTDVTISILIIGEK